MATYDQWAIQRTRDTGAAWAGIARKFDAMAYRTRVAAWLKESALGHATERYTVTERSVGALTLTLPDGSTLAMNAPIPLA